MNLTSHQPCYYWCSNSLHVLDEMDDKENGTVERGEGRFAVEEIYFAMGSPEVFSGMGREVAASDIECKSG